MASWPYSSPVWKRVRQRVLARDGFRCQLRLAKCRGRADSVDHIVAWQDGGALFDMANLQSACRSCNNAKRNKNLAELARVARDPAGRFAHRRTPSREW